MPNALPLPRRCCAQHSAQLLNLRLHLAQDRHVEVIITTAHFYLCESLLAGFLPHLARCFSRLFRDLSFGFIAYLMHALISFLQTVRPSSTAQTSCVCTSTATSPSVPANVFLIVLVAVLRLPGHVTGFLPLLLLALLRLQQPLPLLLGLPKRSLADALRPCRRALSRLPRLSGLARLTRFALSRDAALAASASHPNQPAFALAFAFALALLINVVFINLNFFFVNLLQKASEPAHFQILPQALLKTLGMQLQPLDEAFPGNSASVRGGGAVPTQSC
mmetsp:Transcript_107844/g.196711  ORF Transcript_107844/g.196711 Transcript_107844/m.196711 type:complete len:277 (+) Transcript_107844:752-1582(+)